MISAESVKFLYYIIIGLGLLLQESYYIIY